MNNYSVLISLYFKESPLHLREALDSIFSQTCRSNDVVLVEDGTLGEELELVVREYENKYPELHVVRFEKNRGLGFALNDGILECKNEIVARMDTDDIAKPERMEKQMQVMEAHPEYGMISSWIDEFITTKEHVTSVRKLPEQPEEVREYAKKRCPVNHPTVMFRKSEMLMNGCQVYNIQESLLWFRYDPQTFMRRGGWKYACDEAITQWNIFCLGFISLPRMMMNVAIRFTVRVMPNWVRGLIYKKMLRK